VFTSASIVFLLRNEDYFNIPQDKLGLVTSTTMVTQLVAQTLSSVFIGFMYDSIGRRWTIGLSFLFMAIALVSIPYCAPSVMAVSGARGLLGIAI
jgi:MFS family permease